MYNVLTLSTDVNVWSELSTLNNRYSKPLSFPIVIVPAKDQFIDVEKKSNNLFSTLVSLVLATNVPFLTKKVVLKL